MIVTGEKMAKIIIWIGVVFLILYMLAGMFKLIPGIDFIVPMLILASSILTLVSSSTFRTPQRKAM